MAKNIFCQEWLVKLKHGIWNTERKTWRIKTNARRTNHGKQQKR